MLSSPPKPVRRVVLCRHAAFTIIELLTVMAIILILAGLVLAIAGNAQNKAAQSRATGEISAFSTAANNYQVDNGSYPRVTAAADATTNSDSLDARQYRDPASTGAPTYAAASLVLYRLLSGTYYLNASGATAIWSKGITVNGSTVPQPTVYFPFKTNQLKNNNSLTTGYVNPSDVLGILDPFGFCYGYSTAYQADIDNNNASTPPSTATPTHGYNPTYDLWSTAGYSATSGKAYPAANSVAVANIPTLWVKNW